MPGADSAEVSQVQGRDFGDFESCRYREHSGVDSSQREVGVLPHQFGHSSQIAAGEIHKLDFLISDGFQKRGLDLRPYASFQEIANLREYRAQYEYGAVHMGRAASVGIAVLRDLPVAKQQAIVDEVLAGFAWK